jgi:phage-related holin
LSLYLYLLLWIGWKKYIFRDWEFLKFLVVLIVIDTLVSWVFHLRKKDFSSKGFAMIMTKLFVYSCLLIVAHVLGGYTIDGQVTTTFTWFRSLMSTALIVRESVSIVENAGKISPNLVPSWIRKYLRDFDENGFLKWAYGKFEIWVPIGEILWGCPYLFFFGRGSAKAAF